MSELKPCPFCGGEPEIRDYRVSCSECGSFGKWQSNAENAAAAWNRRALPDPSPAPEEPGEAEVEAALAEEILQRVRKLKIAENDHAKKIAVDECSTSRDEADLHHAKLLRFTLADIDRAIRSLRPSSREQVLAEAAAEDFTIDDALAARDVLQYLGIGDDASLEPSDRRRNKIAAIIRARVDAAIEALAKKETGA